MKKIIVIMLAIVMMLSLVSCGVLDEIASMTPEPTSTENGAQPTEEVQGETGITPEALVTEKPADKSDTVTAKPTSTPKPTTQPTAKPTSTPKPTTQPTAKPTSTPKPTAKPTVKPTATPKPTTNTNTSIVYITKTGKKYHSRTSCNGLSNANEIYQSTLSSAVGAGLTPCSKCY